MAIMLGFIVFVVFLVCLGVFLGFALRGTAVLVRFVVWVGNALAGSRYPAVWIFGGFLFMCWYYS